MNIAHDLFLLMVNLSQLHHRKKIIEFFIDGMNDIFQPVKFSFMEKGGDGDIDIRIKNSLFGFIKVEKTENLLKENKSLVQNAVQMLAVILQNLEFDEKLKADKKSLEQIAHERFNELQSMVKELQQARNDSINLIEDLREEIEKRIKYEKELKKSEENYRVLKENLEKEVVEKTKELKKRVEDLERFHDATIEREFRMKELRDEIERLKGSTP